VEAFPVLVLKEARLVYLANPKTASRSIRAMLSPHAEAIPLGKEGTHLNAAGYARLYRADIADWLGADPETFAVMRDPLDHVGSWFRYRKRDSKRQQATSTRDITFAAFIEARLSGTAPAYARIGRQDRFLGFGKHGPAVTYVFDYARLDLLVDFLSERVKDRLILPMQNVSPKLDPHELVLPYELEARYRAEYAEEFSLYNRVAEAGLLVNRAD
jgi:hypothetical protein